MSPVWAHGTTLRPRPAIRVTRGGSLHASSQNNTQVVAFTIRISKAFIFPQRERPRSPDYSLSKQMSTFGSPSLDETSIFFQWERPQNTSYSFSKQMSPVWAQGITLRPRPAIRVTRGGSFHTLPQNYV